MCLSHTCLIKNSCHITSVNYFLLLNINIFFCLAAQSFFSQCCHLFCGYCKFNKRLLESCRITDINFQLLVVWSLVHCQIQKPLFEVLKCHQKWTIWKLWKTFFSVLNHLKCGIRESKAVGKCCGFCRAMCWFTNAYVSTHVSALTFFILSILSLFLH